MPKNVFNSAKSVPRHHLLIAGTGRSGTSALVRLLSGCGLETVFERSNNAHWSQAANAGAESLILQQDDLPYVIKSPWAYQYIDDLLDDNNIVIDRVIIPIRRLAHAAESRIITEMAAQNVRQPELLGYKTPWADFGLTPGGVVSSYEPIDQQRVLGRSLHLLIEALEERTIPFTFLSFPRYVSDPDYAWERLRDVIPDIRKDVFAHVLRAVLDENHVRTESEVEHAPNCYGPPEKGEEASATLGDLRVASLLREIKELKLLNQNNDINSVCNNPNEAPNGISHGDADIGPEGLQGWHWNTFRRPENPRYGYQIAHSDTTEISRIRRLINGAWSLWKLVY